MKRRSFIKHAVHSLAVPGFLGGLNYNSFGQTLDSILRLANNSDRALILIYLEGGNDGLNTVVPLSDYSALHKVRPHVIMPENKLLSLPAENFAFHPSLPGFRSLYNEKRLQVIHSTGYPDQSFSHFRSTDIWMSATDANNMVTSGWPGRYLESTHPLYPDIYPNVDNPDPLAIEIGHGASMLFQGEKANFSMVLNDTNSFYKLLENSVDQTPDNLAGNKLKYIRLIAQQSQKYGEVVKKAAEKTVNQKPFPEGNRLARQLKIVSRLIAGGLKTPLYLVRLSGFDTHDNQVDGNNKTTGHHANLLKELDEAIMSFMQDLEYQGTADRVMGMTFSEFGRRIVSNASLGTDHGSSAPMFIFGNMSYGGSLGTAPTITGSEVYRDNLSLQHDFRQVYTSLLAQWLKADVSARNFATLKPFEQVPVVKNAVITSVVKKEIKTLKIYPNPVKDFAVVQTEVKSENLRIDLIDSNGRHVAKMFEEQVQERFFERSFNFSYFQPGRYILRVMDGRIQYTLQVLKI